MLLSLFTLQSRDCLWRECNHTGESLIKRFTFNWELNTNTLAWQCCETMILYCKESLFSDFNSSNIMSTLWISQILLNSSVFFFSKGNQFLHSRTIIFTLTCNFLLSNAKFRHIQFLACYHDSVIECNLLQSCNFFFLTLQLRREDARLAIEMWSVSSYLACD